MKKIAVYGLLALAIAILGFNVYAWYFPPKERTFYRVQATPYEATRIYRDIQTHLASLNVEVLDPTPKERKKIEKKLGGELPPGDILSIVEIEPLQFGGEGVVTAVEVDGKSEIRVKIYPNKQPFFEFINTREITAGYGVSQEGTAYLARFSHTLFRTGPVRWAYEVGTLGSGVAIPVQSYAVVTASIRF